jgi:hypothetical protein
MENFLNHKKKKKKLTGMDPIDLGFSIPNSYISNI